MSNVEPNVIQTPQGPEPAAAEGPSSRESAPLSVPALAAKADDLEALRTAVIDAAGVSFGLWVSYLFVLFYLLVAAAGVTPPRSFSGESGQAALPQR